MQIAKYSKMSSVVCSMTGEPLSGSCCLTRALGTRALQSWAPSYPLSHIPLRHVLGDNALSSVHSSFLIMCISCPRDLDPAPCSQTRSESCFSPGEGE